MKKLLAVLLAAAMLSSLMTVTGFAAEDVLLIAPAPGATATAPTATFENTSGDNGENAIALTLARSFKAMIPVDLTEDEAKAAAEAAVWSLEPVADSGYLDYEQFPNQTKGGALTEWVTSKKAPFFSNIVSGAETKDGQVYLTLTFDNACYFGTDPSAPHSNGGTYMDVCGYFTITATAGEAVYTGAEIKIAPYDAFHTMKEIYATIDEMVAYAAENTDLYLEKFSMGKSAGYNGLEALDMPYMVLAKDKAAVEKWQTIMDEAENDPASLIKKIEDGTLGDYQVPVLFSNVHANEVAASDGILALTWMLLEAAAADGKIPYDVLTGFTAEGEAELQKQLGEKGVEGSVAVPDLVADTATYLGYIKGEGLNKSGVVDLEKYYTIETKTVDIDELLNDIIFILVPEENVEGRTYLTRQSSGGLDLNRDNSFQTQAETQNMTQMIGSWNPVSFTEFHGRVTAFQCEPCDPPHEPNFEYDLLAEHLVTGGEALGIAAVANNPSYNSYVIPQRDYLSYTGVKNEDGTDQTMWYDPWDDMSTSYTPQFAMLHGTVAYTVELPAYSDDTTQAVAYGSLGQSVYVAENKEGYLLAQTKILQRGVENYNSNAYEEVGQWFCDVYDVEGAEAELFRPEYDGEGQNGNFYPECYIIPMDGQNQNNLQAAADMMTWLARNDVKILTAETEFTYDGVTYPAGTMVVSMYQAKRSVANGALYNGTVITGWPVLYSEGITAFNKTRGFDMVTCAEPAAYETIKAACGQWMDAEDCAEFLKGVKSFFAGVEDEKVILVNASEDSTAAVNALLKAGKTVGMILAGEYAGSFTCDYADWQTVSAEYLITGVGVAAADAPMSLKITQAPKIYVNGKPADNTSGFVKTTLVASSNNYNYDKQAVELMGFEITENLEEATLIIGSAALSKDAIAAVENGTAYIGYGSTAIQTITGYSSRGTTVPGCLLPEGSLVRSSVGGRSMDALGYVTYPETTLVNASYVAEGDDILYGYGAGYFSQIPEGAEVLVQMDSSKELLEGFLVATGAGFEPFKSSIQAISYQEDGMNIVLFANTLTNKVHQRDEYGFIANQAFSAVLGEVVTGANDVEGAKALAEMKFDDVQSADWYADEVGKAVAAGIVNGMGDDTFQAAEKANKAALLNILYKQAGAPAVETTSDEWYAPAAAWAVQKGIIAEGTDVTAELTREEAVMMLWNDAKASGKDVSVGEDTNILSYPDAFEITEAAIPAIQWACGSGIMEGNEKSELNPTDAATRAEMIALVVRYIG